MEPYPTLTTDRLLLQEFVPSAAPALRRLANDRKIARSMVNLPHPYEKSTAERWISGLCQVFEEGFATAFAVVLREGGTIPGFLYAKEYCKR